MKYFQNNANHYKVFLFLNYKLYKNIYDNYNLQQPSTYIKISNTCISSLKHTKTNKNA